MLNVNLDWKTVIATALVGAGAIWVFDRYMGRQVEKVVEKVEDVALNSPILQPSRDIGSYFHDLLNPPKEIWHEDYGWISKEYSVSPIEQQGIPLVEPQMKVSH